jgi:hypothetical protein
MKNSSGGHFVSRFSGLQELPIGKLIRYKAPSFAIVAICKSLLWQYLSEGK